MSDTHIRTSWRRYIKIMNDMRMRPDGVVRRPSMGRLICFYTFVFAVFFACVFSPFWVYERSFFRSVDGLTQYLPELTYSRSWLGDVLGNLRQGRFEIPFWSLNIGLGQRIFGNVVSFKPLNFLYCLFPRDSLELYLIVRMALGLYLSGLSFLAFGWSRTKNTEHLLLGCMIYVFSGFIPFTVTRHWLFMEMTFAFPLMLVGVDQIFDGKWSWLFIITVFVIAMSYYYTLFLITLPAVIYALFHFFELDKGERAQRGGLGRIFLRHVVQYMLGVGLAMVSLLPMAIVTLDSCRMATQEDMSLLFWKPWVYLKYIEGIVAAKVISYGGSFLALPSLALTGVMGVFFYHRKKDRLLYGQIAFYTLVFLVPALTMLFNAFMGKTMRWFFAYTFWIALATACVLPKLQRDKGPAFFFCMKVFCVYALAFLGACVWMGKAVSISMVLAFVGISVFWLVFLSDHWRKRKRVRIAVIFLVLLVELTAKSYERFSPQYENIISSFFRAGQLLDRAKDDAIEALKLVDDDGIYRVDSVVETAHDRSLLANYGVRNGINGVSSYHNLNSDRLVSWSLGLGNSHQGSPFEITDLAQRTVLNALTGVRYAVALEDAKARVPYGYERVESRDKRLTDGTETKANLYRNQYALPIAYTYDHCIDAETYAKLPPNRKEQAILQGVVLEDDMEMPQAELKFDDMVLLDGDGIIAELERIAADDENLDIVDGVLHVKKANFTASITVEPVEGEVYLQFTGIDFRSVNYASEGAEHRIANGENRLKVMASKRNARQWEPDVTSVLSVSCGSADDEVDLRDPSNQYYFGKRDVLLNLGYIKTEKKLKIKFSKPGTYRFDSASLICQPMDSYAEKIAPLQAKGALSTQVDVNRVTLQFECDGDALACLSIPFDGGWSARVDGEPAEIVPANVAFMGVKLTKGAHTVEFSYLPRGLRLGAAISLIMLIALIGIGMHQALRRRSRG